MTQALPIAAVVLALATHHLPARAETAPLPPPPRFVLHGGAGVITAGTIHVEDVDSSTATGPYLTLGADAVFGTGSFGGYLVYADLDEVAVKAAGLDIKLRIALGARAQLRVGLGVAYQASNLYVASDTATPITGLGIAPFAELALSPAASYGLTLQVSAVSQPVGGADGVAVTWTPIPTIALVAEARLR